MERLRDRLGGDAREGMLWLLGLVGSCCSPTPWATSGTRQDQVANVAGIMDWFLPAHEVDDEAWNRVMAVNVNGPMMLCRKVLPGMLERGAGAIVNVASVAGLRGGGAGIAYTTSKHALVGMTRSIAIVTADGGWTAG